MALFIGGPLDGKIVEVEPSREHVEVAINQPLSINDIKIDNKNIPTKTLTEVFYYKKEVLSCPTNVFSLFVPRSYNCEDVVISLIEGYRQSVTQNISNQ